MGTHAEKRLPHPTPLTEPWWEACRRHELLIQRCADCGEAQFYPRIFCAACSGVSVNWERASGRGRVITFTIIRRAVSEAYTPEVPYPLALIELAEGPTMMSALTECDPEEVVVNMPVEVVFEEWTDRVTMPLFRPAQGA